MVFIESSNMDVNLLCQGLYLYVIKFCVNTEYIFTTFISRKYFTLLREITYSSIDIVRQHPHWILGNNYLLTIPILPYGFTKDITDSSSSLDKVLTNLWEIVLILWPILGVDTTTLL